jgi:hypothetical protein
VQDPSAQSGPCRLNQVAVGHVAQESVAQGTIARGRGARLVGVPVGSVGD